jgi:enoyl-CoA hydratase
VETTRTLVVTELQVDGVAVMTLNNPPLNLQTLDLMRELECMVMALDEDDAVRAVVLTGAGTRVFSAGSDVKEFPKLRANFVEEKLRRENAVFSRIEQMKKPVIAAICGSAMGGGCELALACDFRIIDESAKIALPEINLGSFPGSGGLVRLSKLIGSAKAMELMSLGTVLDAESACRIGLVNSVSRQGNALADARKLAHQLSRQAVFAIRCIKKAVQAASTQTSAEAVEMSLRLSEEIFRTADSREGMLAFIEKRRAVFAGAPKD